MVASARILCYEIPVWLSAHLEFNIILKVSKYPSDVVVR